MATDSDPRFVFFDEDKMPDTMDLCEDEEFQLEGATQFLRSAAEHRLRPESSVKSDETNCSIEVDVEGGTDEAPVDALSGQSENDFEINEEDAIAELKALELKTLSSNDDRHLRSISDLARSKAFSGTDSRTPLQHLNYLMKHHPDNTRDLVDLFPSDCIE